MKPLKALLLLSLVLGALFAAAVSTGSASACVPAARDCKGVCRPHGFLGLSPWYQYLHLKESKGQNNLVYCDVDFRLLPNGSDSSSIPLVLLAILDDLVRIAGLAAVFFVIFGGVKYITSQGSPDSTKQAQTTIINAAVGLTIAILATAFVAFIGKRLAGG